jgi:hypothetical protein
LWDSCGCGHYRVDRVQLVEEQITIPRKFSHIFLRIECMRRFIIQRGSGPLLFESFKASISNQVVVHPGWIQLSPSPQG